MYQNAFQGRFISVFYSKGSKPLSSWDTNIKNGYIKRVTDFEINSLALEIKSTNVMNTFITCPNPRFKSLGIKLPFLCLIIKNLNHFFSLEVQVMDSSNTKRRLRFSNYNTCCKITTFLSTFPICLNAGWNEMKIDLADFVFKSYGSLYRETVYIKVHASCRLRRIFFSDKLYDNADLPAEYKLCHKSDQLVPSKTLDEFPLPPSDLGENEDEVEDGMFGMRPQDSADMLHMPSVTEDVRADLPSVTSSLG